MFDNYRRQVRNGLRIDSGVNPIAHVALGLTGEAGEVADLVKKSQYAGGKPVDRDNLLLELGDLLWYLQAMADLFGFSLEELALANIAKLEERHPTRGYSISELLNVGDRDTFCCPEPRGD